MLTMSQLHTLTKCDDMIYIFIDTACPCQTDGRTVLWKSSMVNSVKPWLTRSSLLLAAMALNLQVHVFFPHFNKHD